MIIRSSTTYAEAVQFGQQLAQSLPKNSLVIASVDFSHYMSQDQALPLDQHSAQQLKLLDPAQAKLVEADSPQTLVAITAYMQARDAKEFSVQAVENSATWSNDLLRTTGYVIGFYY